MARKDYWTKREAEHQRKRIRDEKAYNAEIRKIYENMADIATKEINGFYAKYAAKEGITLAEAKRRISTADIAEYAKKAEKYVPAKDLSDKANEEMRLYNAMMSINRLEMLKSSIGLGMVDGFEELDQTMREHLTDAAEEEFVRQAGILGGTVRNPREAANTIVNSSFHNATFSQRIWMHQGMLRSELDKVLQEGLIKGESSLKLARHISKVFGASRKDAERLMRTEMSRVYTEAQKESYDAAGYEDYTYIALGDACEICAPLDGKHFKVKQMRVGENAPPMHPNCRCSTAPWMERYSHEGEPDRKESGGEESWEEWAENLDSELFDDLLQRHGFQSGNKDLSAEEKRQLEGEIYKKLTQGIGFKDVDKSFWKNDYRLMNECADKLQVLENRFNAVHKLGCHTIGGKNKSSNTMGFVRNEGAELHLCSRYNSSRKFLERRILHNVSSGKHMPIDEGMAKLYVVTHEYGHLVGYAIREDLKAAGHDVSDFFIDARHDIISIARNNNPNFDIDRSISDYARKNEKEFFAECFVNYQLGKPNDLGEAMHEWLLRRGY